MSRENGDHLYEVISKNVNEEDLQNYQLYNEKNNS